MKRRQVFLGLPMDDEIAVADSSELLGVFVGV
jgi:hypothetical protein